VILCGKLTTKDNRDFHKGRKRIYTAIYDIQECETW